MSMCEYSLDLVWNGTEEINLAKNNTHKPRRVHERLHARIHACLLMCTYAHVRTNWLACMHPPYPSHLKRPLQKQCGNALAVAPSQRT